MYVYQITIIVFNILYIECPAMSALHGSDPMGGGSASPDRRWKYIEVKI